MIIESTSVPLPMRSPVRAFSSRYGALDMDSMPPATATSYSPAWMALPASMTARMPEPQTLWTVTHGTVFGMPAPSEACRAGAWPMPAWRTLPMMTCSTSSGATPARSRAARMAAEPSAGAGREESLPRNEPTGVRAAERITRFFIGRRILLRAGPRGSRVPPAGPIWRTRASSRCRIVVAWQYVLRQSTSFRHCRIDSQACRRRATLRRRPPSRRTCRRKPGFVNTQVACGGGGPAGDGAGGPRDEDRAAERPSASCRSPPSARES